MEKLTILCVDDQRDVLRAIARDMSEFESWTEVEECESADEALGVLADVEEQGRPLALIICDHVMPGLLGVDFLARIEKSSRHKHVKKVLITGHASHVDTINAINFAGVDAYVSKPWSSADLQKTCRRLLTQYLFDAGLDVENYRSVMDPEIMLQRMSGMD